MASVQIGQMATLLSASFPDDAQRIRGDLDAALRHFAIEGALTLR